LWSDQRGPPLGDRACYLVDWLVFIQKLGGVSRIIRVSAPHIMHLNMNQCVIVPRTIAPPTAYAGSAISENRQEDECEDKADYDVHGVCLSDRVNKLI
jgi:hypothetical protein